MTKFEWILKQITQKLWVRTSIFAVLSVITALVALLLKDYIPEDTSRKIGAESVDSLLHIIASSMLAVTTFSLSIMVAAYSAATTNVTPRATQLLLADNTSQNAISVFIGSFIFSIVGIVALTMGVYGSGGRLVLFGVTVVVIMIIIIVMIQWINYLSKLGRVHETISRVEQETAHAVENHLKNPYLEGAPLIDFMPGDSHHPLYLPKKMGYIQHIDIEALNKQAKEFECKIFVKCLPGDFCDGVVPLLYTSHQLTDKAAQKLRDAFTIDSTRSFSQDPRFGLIVLSEIASRALSPALNDPGTAINVIGAGLRILTIWVRPEQTTAEVKYINVFVPPVATASLLNGFFTPIARDGAGIVEIGIHLQKALATLAAVGGSLTVELAKRHSMTAFKRAEKSLLIEDDIERLSSLVMR